MKKKILITSTDLMMIQFLIPHVKKLVKNGYAVDVACSEVGGRFAEVKEQLKGLSQVFRVRLARNPYDIHNIVGLKDLKIIFKRKNYDLVWTNEPVMGVMTRIACKKYRKQGTKIMYMVHGFHFYKGAPIIRWLLFYPVEKKLSSITDVLVTMNMEDYERAKTFKALKVEYIHGIGVDISFYKNVETDQTIRNTIGIKQEDFCFLNVGELTERKNQGEIIDALAKTKNRDKIKLVICGVGPLEGKLRDQVKKYGLEDNVCFLGYRKDVEKFYGIVDAFIFPSLQEGLSRAVMEAMSSALPVICSKIRGNIDLIDENGGIAIDNKYMGDYVKALDYFVDKKENIRAMGEYNQQKVMNFDFSKVACEIENIIKREIG